MCGIAGLFGKGWDFSLLSDMARIQRHRGPDAEGYYRDPDGWAGLAHNRLSIIDLSAAGNQPMSDASGRYSITFNGEIYNYLELRSELESRYPFRTRTDTEVLLAAYVVWGPACLDRLIGMFAFAIWDCKEKQVFLARDRFGVKPLHYAFFSDDRVAVASEIKAIHAAGLAREPDTASWASYLAHGLYDQGESTFWKNVSSLPAGHSMHWRNGKCKVSQWYDLAPSLFNSGSASSFMDAINEYSKLLKDSTALRFRADVPVGVCLSGGLDSSLLLQLVRENSKRQETIAAFTFITGDLEYDELPWVEAMLEGTNLTLHTCRLSAQEVPSLAAEVQWHQDAPFGGIPTLAYARLFETASSLGYKVLLDGQGMDEQWAGYDYYIKAMEGNVAPIIQGASSSALAAECLAPDFHSLAQQPTKQKEFPRVLDRLRYRDIFRTKLPRALRFNDRISMRSSLELREPFLDHRLIEFAFSQPTEYLIRDGIGKWFLRELAKVSLPAAIREAPKRALQTPQREWLRGQLQEWAREIIQLALNSSTGTWLNRNIVERNMDAYFTGKGDNSFFIWQWISVGLETETFKAGQSQQSRNPRAIGRHIKNDQAGTSEFV